MERTLHTMTKKHIFAGLAFILIFSLLLSAGIAEKGKWGFADRYGNIMIETKFDYVYPFQNNVARVFSGSLTSIGWPAEGKYGYIDRKGNIIIPAEFDYAYDFNNYGQAIVENNLKSGVIDINGNTVIDSIYYKLFFDSKNNVYFGNHYDSPSGTWYIIDLYGKETEIDCYSVSYTADGCFSGGSDESHNFKEALFSITGERLTEFQYDYISDLSGTICKYSFNKKIGLINSSGKEITDPIFDSIGQFYNGHAAAIYNDKYCLIDQEGNIIHEYNVDWIDLSDALKYDGIMCAFTGALSNGIPREGQYFLINEAGTILSKEYDYTIKLESYDHFTARKGDTRYILDREGNESIYPVKCTAVDWGGTGRLIPQKSGLYAITDLQGNMISDFIWSNVKISESDEYGWFCVCE